MTRVSPIIILLLAAGCVSRPSPALPAAFNQIFRAPFPAEKNCRWKAGEYSRALTGAGVDNWVVCIEQPDGQWHAKVLTCTTLEDPTTGTVKSNGEDAGRLLFIVSKEELNSERWR
jgi:hypothetical protein